MLITVLYKIFTQLFKETCKEFLPPRQWFPTGVPRTPRSKIAGVGKFTESWAEFLQNFAQLLLKNLRVSLKNLRVRGLIVFESGKSVIKKKVGNTALKCLSILQTRTARL